jgi:hypothetical protein
VTARPAVHTPETAVGTAAERAAVTDGDVEVPRAPGYRDRNILDGVGLVALDVLTGSFGLVAGLEREALAATA